MARRPLVIHRAVSGGQEKVTYWGLKEAQWLPFRQPVKLPERGPQGSYALRRMKGDIYLYRTSGTGKPRWEVPLPHGYSTWDSAGGGAVTLPWEHADLAVRAVALCGIDPELVVHQPESVQGLALGLGRGVRGLDGHPYDEYVIRNGGAGVEVEPMVNIRQVEFVVQFRYYAAWQNFREKREVAFVHLWPVSDKKKKIVAQQLMEVLRKNKLYQNMAPWEEALYREVLKTRKK
ncbi:MAG: hypothetical protein GC129_03045 [Proteobacteria bacterium]|nr:hypothetical protein [Pseudomonadota bacterium]